MSPYHLRIRLVVVLIITTLGGFRAWSADRLDPPMPNSRADRTFLYSGGDFNSFNSYFAYVGGTFAPFGQDASGLRVGGFAGAGSYEYETTSRIRSTGKFSTADGMIGWGIVTEKTNTKFMIGANIQDQILSRPDPTNPVQGTKTGFKAHVDTYMNPTSSTMMFALGSYSTAFRTYYSEMKFGIAVLNDVDVFVGPQFIALGNQRFDQWRVGLHLTGMHLGLINVGIAGGYLHESDLGNGAYGMISANVRF
jgi:hypothetical protein